MAYERVQILLEPRQRKALQQLARRKHKSLSQIMREMTDQFLGQKQNDDFLQALDELTKLRNRIAEEYGVYHGDPVAEARAEREREMDDVLKDMFDDRH